MRDLLAKWLAAVASALMLLVSISALPAMAQSAPLTGKGIGIRLLDAPSARASDPRAQIYIVDHVHPGASFTRHIEVTNDTPNPVRLDLYAAAAEVSDGGFRVVEGRSQNELTGWISVSPSVVDLPSRGTARATVEVNVPKGASAGERYGVVVAELPAIKQPGKNVAVAGRVGVRVYLDVGAGGEPASNFAITTLTAERSTDGSPVVMASVKNTGGRALDMSGKLWLKNGPGGLSAGPFPAQLGTTLGIGQEEPVTVKLDKQLPAGPWLAHLEMQSGLIKHAAEATITFPAKAGAVGKTVKAKTVPLTKDKKFLGIVAGSLILLVVLGILFVLFLLWRRRRKDDDEEKRRGGPPTVPQPRAQTEPSHQRTRR